MTWRALRDKWVYLVGPVIILGAWELLSRLGVLRATFFPPPTRIVSGADIIFQGGNGLADDIVATVTRVFITVVLAVALGVIIGVLASASAWTERGITTLLAFVYPIPGVLFFPFLAFVFGRSQTAILLTALITPLVVIVLYTMSGVRSISPVLLEVAQNYNSNGIRRFFQVVLPGALPTIVTGIRIALGFALIAVIAIEMVGAQDGLGRFLWANWQILRVTDMYVALMCIAVLGLLSSIGFDAVADKLLPWRRDERNNA
ncbi:MAG TPA: ABC transporter permease [Brevibacterium sp.]|nr:ABC transporter permease [Brevibacterium sp.]